MHFLVFDLVFPSHLIGRTNGFGRTAIAVAEIVFTEVE